MKKPGRLNLFRGGRDNFEKTKEYENKVKEIKKELRDKYSEALTNERNWVKRLLIKLRMELEIRKRIQALSSLRNLHIIRY